MFKHSPNGEGMVETPTEYTLIVYSPNEKGMMLWNIVSWGGNHYGKR